jgi:hypothetical protein
MNANLLDQLLNESESSYLDFKREQYSFEGADDDTKGELLKDILAFANAWRRTDAYILIGVEEVRGGRNKVLGISKHLEDHSLQQFVNSKTQQPITFSYMLISFEGLQVGVIKIPVQTRPFHLKKDFGKLKKNIVYMRRGSSTDEALPDEIAKIGVASVQDLNSVVVDLQFGDIKSQALLGNSITVKSKFLDIPDNKIPEFTDDSSSRFPNISIGINQPNKKYYRELVKYYDDRFLTEPVGFALKNLGQSTIRNVRMLVSIEPKPHLRLLLADEFPSRPQKYYNYMMMLSPVNISSNILHNNKPSVSLETYAKKWVLIIDFGDVQPKATAWCDEFVFVGSQKSEMLIIEAQLFADDLPDPISVKLNVNFEIEDAPLNLHDLENLLKTEFQHNFDEIDE